MDSSSSSLEESAREPKLLVSRTRMATRAAVTGAQLNWDASPCTGNVTLQSGPGFAGVDKGILRLDSLGVSGGMIIENSGDAVSLEIPF